jgi:NAD(P)H-dependent FMN reductase
MSDTRFQLAVIIGSTRQGRLGPAIARWFAAAAETRADVAVDLIDLAEAGLPAVMSSAASPEVAALGVRLAAADAFVIVTPEYNHSFPAPLKHAIDFYSTEWQAKPIAFVSYGGISGGLRAVEQLRQVFAELHAVTIRDTISLHGVWSQFSATAELRDDPARARAVQTLLDRLAWWALALRDARLARPFAA